MCGIVYGESFDGTPVNNYVFDQYVAQKNRGQQGFGVFDGINNRLVHAAEESRIVNWLAKEKNESSLLLMHHRFPTSTINVRRAAHPFTTKDYFGDNEYILVHNGSVRNADDLFTAHQELGIEYYSLLEDMTFNDSEALLWDFALTMEGRQDEMQAYGGIAFICLKLVKGRIERMFFARNTNPLNMLRNKDGIFLSSEGEGEPIEPHKLYNWNYKLKRLTKRNMQIDSYVYAGGYNASDYEYNRGGYQSYPGYGDYWNADGEDDYSYPDSGYNYPNWVPSGVRQKFDRYLKKKNNSSYYDITDSEVQALTAEYLTAAEGHFETAYWMVEGDYMEAQEELEVGEDFESLRDIRLIELVLDYISSDPDYVDEFSYSKELEASWQQQLSTGS